MYKSCTKHFEFISEIYFKADHDGVDGGCWMIVDSVVWRGCVCDDDTGDWGGPVSLRSPAHQHCHQPLNNNNNNNNSRYYKQQQQQTMMRMRTLMMKLTWLHCSKYKVSQPHHDNLLLQWPQELSSSSSTSSSISSSSILHRTPEPEVNKSRVKHAESHYQALFGFHH